MPKVNVWASGMGVWRASLESSGDAESDRRKARRAIVNAIVEREQKVGEHIADTRLRVSATLGRIVKEEPQEGDELVVYRENV